MSIDLRVFAGVLFALLVAVGVWWFARARGAGSAPAAIPPGMPGPASGEGGDAFQQTLEWQHLRHEMASLQIKFDEQSRIIDTLHAEIIGLREQLAGGGLQRSVSPEYDEALVYARQGLGAAAIAERCGITLAEAELVRSMAGQ